MAHLLEHLYAERFDQLVEHIALARAVVDLVEPRVIVLGNDRWWVGQAFVRAAQRRGIPTLLLQDGLTGDKATWWWISADHLAAFSPTFARTLSAHGVARERITITGQPRYDALCERRQRRDGSSVMAARKKLAVKADTCVLLATQPHQTPDRVSIAVKSLLTASGVHVLLRPHPNEPPGKYDACVNGHLGRVSIQAGIDMHLLLDAADILVTEFSTVALEAAIVGIPVIIASMLGDRSAPEVFDGLSVHVDNAEALRDAVCALERRHGKETAGPTVDPERLYALVGPLDGRAGLRVARLIDSLSSRGIKPPRGGRDSLATTINS